MSMDMDVYQAETVENSIYPGRGTGNIVYPALGLCGEAGEFADKVKKLIRDNGGVLTDEARTLLLKEVGDVLWYVSAAAHELGVSLSEVAEMNLEKIRGRVQRGTQGGSGDNR